MRHPGAFLTANKAANIKLYLESSAIPKGGATVVQIDDNFKILKTLGTFEPPADPPQGGEQVCSVNFPPMEPGTVIRISAIPTDPGLRPNFSPVSTLKVLVPKYTPDNLAILARVAEQAKQIYRDQFAKLNDAPAARRAAVEAIKKLPEVSDCKIAPDGVSIGIGLKFGGGFTIQTQ